MTQLLEGKVVIVTGAGGGVGRAVALALARAGAKLVVNDLGCGADGAGRSTVPASAVAKEIAAAGGEAIPDFSDVTDIAAVEHMFSGTIQRYGKIDILVTGAGVVRDAAFFAMTEEDWDMMVRVHLKGAFLCIRQASRSMREQHSGRIIAMGGIGGLLGSPGRSNYGVAMSGVIGLTKTASRDLGRYGITCNCILPITTTRGLREEELEFGAKLNRADTAEARETFGADGVGALVVYLASDAGADVNGQSFIVAGRTIAYCPVPRPLSAVYRNALWDADSFIKEASLHLLPHMGQLRTRGAGP